jgi:hypothetical protein
MAQSRVVVQREIPSAMLRRLIQPLYDTTIVGGVGDGAYQLLQFFTIPKNGLMPWTAVPKTDADTNMNSQSKLGVPLVFDWMGINYEYFTHSPEETENMSADYGDAYDQSVFTFFFSNGRPWHQFPLSRIPSGTMLAGTVATGDITGNSEFAYLSNGLPSVREVYDVTIGKKAIRINTNETFHCEVSWPNGAVTSSTADRRRARVYLQGDLYTSL